MIHYQLRCGRGHGFDGWFNNSDGYEKQAKLGLIACPECGGTDVDRALMAPALAKRGRIIEAEPEQQAAAAEPAPPPAPAPMPPPMAASGPVPARVIAALQRIRAEVEKHCEYVGEDFAGQARAMHRGEVEAKPIYGETSEDEAERLTDEGIAVSRIPWVPRADG